MVEWTCEVATDGGGNTDDTMKSVGAAAIDFDTLEYALLMANTHGKQTVPRSELSAITQVLKLIDTKTNLRVIVDARYVVDGVYSTNRQKYIIGASGDLWLRRYQLWGSWHGKLEVYKTKARVSTVQEWQRYSKHFKCFVLNEMADFAVNTSARKYKPTAEQNVQRTKRDGSDWNHRFTSGQNRRTSSKLAHCRRSCNGEPRSMFQN